MQGHRECLEMTLTSFQGCTILVVGSHCGETLVHRVRTHHLPSLHHLDLNPLRQRRNPSLGESGILES